jgi:glycosyltransferase involved in cell wall biosynthesis
MKSQMEKRLAYLSLETPVQGQAAYAHIHEMIAGLEEQGWHIERYFATRTGASKGASLFVKMWDYLRVQIRLMRELHKVDAVFVRGHFAALLIAIVCRLRGVPIIHEINGAYGDVGVTYPWARRVMGMLGAIQRWQYRHASHLVAVTPQLTQWAMIESGHTRVSTVMNGVNTRLFSPEGERHISLRPYVIFVGGLVKWHGVETMLKALYHPAWPHNLDLMIVGDGVERAQLQACQHPQLIWQRHHPYEHVPSFIRGALAGLVPIESPAGRSNYGVLPLKLFEMMACGIPVIATDLPAQREIVIEAYAGIIIPMCDPEALAQAVAFLNQNVQDSQRIGRNGALIAKQNHDWRLRARQINDLLKAL